MGLLDWMNRAPENEQGRAPEWQTLKVYLYRHDGRYGPPNWAETPEEFTKMIPQIRKHMDGKLEVRVTNCDDHLLFHATDKGIEWDGINLGKVIEHDRKQPKDGPANRVLREGPLRDR
jgi:hypothetical protein